MYLGYLLLCVLVVASVAAHKGHGKKPGRGRKPPGHNHGTSNECQLPSINKFKKIGCFNSRSSPMSSMIKLNDKHVHAHRRRKRDIADDIEENEDEVLDFRNFYLKSDDFAKQYDLREHVSMKNDKVQELYHDLSGIDHPEETDYDPRDLKQNNFDQSDHHQNDHEETELDQVNDPHGKGHHHRKKPGKKNPHAKLSYAAFSNDLVCRCATAAMKRGYRYFAIRNFNKCMLGRSNYNDMVKARGEHKKHRLSCRSAVHKKDICIDHHLNRCVGGKNSDYVYMNVKDPCLVNEGGCSNYCENVKGFAKCSCSAGYELATDTRTCKDIDECDTKNGGCDHQCINKQGSHLCACKEGFTINDDGKSCSDINECNVKKGGCTQICINSPGSYRCDCKNGYKLSVDTKTCSVIDQCHDPKNMGVCHHDCLNSIGTFKCGCFLGFRLSSDGKNCEDINECTLLNGGCEHKCHNTLGSRYCRCYTGYTLNSDKFSCRDNDECHTKKGGCEQGCVNTIGSFKCLCKPGYTLDTDGKSCKDINECLIHEGICAHRCENTVGSFKCHCKKGFKLLPDKKSCKDINECQSTKSNECSQVCINTNGTYSCSCDSGFELGKEGKICKDIDECETSAKVLCQQDCVNTNGSYRCACQHGYVLSDNKRDCTDIDECDLGKHGCEQQCINLQGTFKCGCNIGFILTDDNRTCADIDECSNNRGGCEQYCNNLIGSFKCVCDKGYILNGDGATCNDIDECEVASMANGGCEHGCSNTKGSFSCSCRPGYRLASNRLNCTDVDECITNNGGCSDDCLNLIGSFKCDCKIGYKLNADGKTCRDVDECSANNGGCSDICNNSPGSFFCLCKSGYKLMDDKKTCKDVNECKAAHRGGCHHQCVNNKGSYTCICRTGFKLSSDGQTCTDINECDKNKGGCAHFCKNTEGSYKCSCKSGYRHINFHSCTDIDECLNKNDGCSDDCFNLEGTYKCGCKSGYLLGDDKRNCQDINECANNNGGCAQICTNIPGSKKCSCEPGYRRSCGDDVCADINECKNKNGGCEHICSNTMGTRKCTCRNRFTLNADQRTCTRSPYKWPKGSYGILSYDSCPPGWYEFTHCLDTQDIGNIDDIKDFKLGLGPLCGTSSISFRYCFKGPDIPSRPGGFFTNSARYGEAYVVENTATNKQSDCSIFGREGGSVAMDTEDISNKDTFGNRGLNRRYFNTYHPRGFFQQRDSFVMLEFCKIGEAEEGMTEDIIEVGKFGTQKFGFFIQNNNRCPILISPYGYLFGVQQRIILDLEDFLNVNHVSKPAPFEQFGNGNLATTVCQYDPKQGKGKDNIPKWPQGSFGILSYFPCPPGWYEFSHCIDTVDWFNSDNAKEFKLGLGNACGSSSISFRYCFKGSKVVSRKGGLTENNGVAYVINNIRNGCGDSGGSVHLVAESSRNRNSFGNNGLNYEVYKYYQPYGYNVKSGDNTVQLSFCTIGTEVGEFGQRFGLLVEVNNNPCPTLQSPYGQLSGSKQYIKLDLQSGNKVYGKTPFGLLSNGNVDTYVCQYDPNFAV